MGTGARRQPEEVWIHDVAPAMVSLNSPLCDLSEAEQVGQCPRSPPRSEPTPRTSQVESFQQALAKLPE